jgi:hypothetical protein
VLPELVTLYLIGDACTRARLRLLLPDLKSVFIPILSGLKSDQQIVRPLYRALVKWFPV